MTQKTLTEEKQPLGAILDLLKLPTKARLDVYLVIVKRWLSGRPLNINMNAYELLSTTCGLERSTVKEKVISLDGANYIHIEWWTLLPRFKLKDSITEDMLAIAMKKYQQDVITEQRVVVNPDALWRNMNGLCIHTGEKIDSDLCRLARWTECQTCTHRRGRDNG